MGKRVAHLVAGRMLDYIEFDDGYAMVKTTPPASILGRPLGENRIRSQVRRHHRRQSSDPVRTSPTPPPRPSSARATSIIVSGKTNHVEHFSDQN